ncbi:hypothetical protein EON73_02180 [bacterium]|nr:MAG: hypothetical protein EON73_02180 [bacterium]
MQNYVLQALQSKALYGGKSTCKNHTKLVLAKTEFLHAKLCKLCKAFWITKFCTSFASVPSKNKVVIFCKANTFERITNPSVCKT